MMKNIKKVREVPKRQAVSINAEVAIVTCNQIEWQAKFNANSEIVYLPGEY